MKLSSERRITIFMSVADKKFNPKMVKWMDENPELY